MKVYRDIEKSRHLAMQIDLDRAYTQDIIESAKAGVTGHALERILRVDTQRTYNSLHEALEDEFNIQMRLNYKAPDNSARYNSFFLKHKNNILEVMVPALITEGSRIFPQLRSQSEEDIEDKVKKLSGLSLKGVYETKLFLIEPMRADSEVEVIAQINKLRNCLR